MHPVLIRLQVAVICSFKLDRHNIFQIMKTSKGIIAIMAHFTEFILANRLSPHPKHTQHLHTLAQEVTILKNQLLPSTEILHFLVDKPAYDARQKLLTKLKTAPVQDLAVAISFTLVDKITSVTHTAETWKLSVRNQKEEHVTPDCTAHQLLSLLQQVIRQISPGEFLSDLVRNCEGTKKYIIDFQLTILDKKSAFETLVSQMGKMWTNQARIDNSRELLIECYTNKHLSSLIAFPKRSPYQISSKAKVKGCSQNTREDSSEIESSDREIRKHRFSEELPTLLEIYDNELDLTIISSDSDELNKGHIISEEVLQEEEFELLIEESNKDAEFLKENESLFGEWEKCLTTIFL